MQYLPPPQDPPAAVATLDPVAQDTSHNSGKVVAPFSAWPGAVRTEHFSLGDYADLKLTGFRDDVGSLVSEEVLPSDLRGTSFNLTYRISKDPISVTSAPSVFDPVVGDDQLMAPLPRFTPTNYQFDNVLKFLGADSMQLGGSLDPNTPAGRLLFIGEEIQHELRLRGAREVSYTIGGTAFGESVRWLTDNRATFSAVRVLYDGHQLSWAPVGTYEVPNSDCAVSIGTSVNDLVTLTNFGTHLYSHRYNFIERQGGQLAIDSYSFKDAPGAIATMIRYRDCAVILGTDSVNKTNVLGIVGDLPLAKMLGLQGASHQGIFYSQNGQDRVTRYEVAGSDQNGNYDLSMQNNGTTHEIAARFEIDGVFSNRKSPIRIIFDGRGFRPAGTLGSSTDGWKLGAGLSIEFTP